MAPYKVRKIGIVSTLLPGLSPKVVEKTLKITTARIAPAGASIVAERRVPHEQAALARAIDEVAAEGRAVLVASHDARVSEGKGVSRILRLHDGRLEAAAGESPPTS